MWDGVRWVLSWSDPDSDPPAFDPEHSVDHSAEWEIEALRRDLDELTARVGGLEGEDGD